MAKRKRARASRPRRTRRARQPRANGNPQFVNQRLRAARPVPARYRDQPPILVRRGMFGTQVSQANYVLYDGRLFDRNTLLSTNDINNFVRTRRSSNQLFELAKGLINQHPELFTAARETFVVMQIWQLMCQSGAAGKTPPGDWREIMRIIEQHMPIAGLLRAISLAVRRDYDTELRFNAQFWARHMPGVPAPLNAAQRRVLVRTFSTRRWQATSRSGMTQVDTANALAQRFNLRRAPALHVQSAGGHLGRGTRLLTQAEIRGI